MSRIDNIQRIIVEDFPPEDRAVASRIAEYYNYFAEQVTETINGNIDYDNLNKELKVVDVIADSSGTPILETRFQADVGLRGLTVIRAQNQDNPSIYPSGYPFISFTPDGTGIYTINNITGLPANNKFRLTLELSY